MLLAVPDCFTSFRHNKPTTTTFLFQRGRRASHSVNPTRTRRLGLCKATLITNSDSFEVGRLLGSYGFMNITSYSGFQSGADTEYPPGDLGQLRVQDVGEGNVKISYFVVFMKGESLRVHLEELQFFLRFILVNELVVWRLI